MLVPWALQPAEDFSRPPPGWHPEFSLTYKIPTDWHSPSPVAKPAPVKFSEMPERFKEQISAANNALRELVRDEFQNRPPPEKLPVMRCATRAESMFRTEYVLDRLVEGYSFGALRDHLAEDHPASGRPWRRMTDKKVRRLVEASQRLLGKRLGRPCATDDEKRKNLSIAQMHDLYRLARSQDDPRGAAVIRKSLDELEGIRNESLHEMSRQIEALRKRVLQEKKHHGLPKAGAGAGRAAIAVPGAGGNDGSSKAN
jgi:hypothetical protein